MKTFSLKALALFAALTATHAAFADETNGAALKLPAIFGDNMVLQQGQPVLIWGWSSKAGAEVIVKFAGQTKTTHSDGIYHWSVKLSPLKASFQPQSLIVEESGTTKVFTNILIGEVWLCSGQSNMEKPIGNQPGQKPCFN